MGSNFMPRSISLYRGIARFSSTHLDGGISHNANDRSKITAWFFYSFVSRMNLVRHYLFLAAISVTYFSPTALSAPIEQELLVYRALFQYLSSHVSAPKSLVIATEAPTSDEVLPEFPKELAAEVSPMSREEILRGYLPATSQLLRNEFLRLLDLRSPIEKRHLAFKRSFGVTFASKQDVDAIFQTEPLAQSWERFRIRFPNAAGMVRLSRPAIDVGSQAALVYVGFSCGGTCGRGHLYLLSRFSSGWRVVHEQQVWVS
jgi:hypothetical protein